jgi:hypothetical protein
MTFRYLKIHKNKDKISLNQNLNKSKNIYTSQIVHSKVTQIITYKI